MAQPPPTRQNATESALFRIWDLPDVVFFRVVSFTAAPTHRATVLCHQVATLCQDARQAILEKESSVVLWETVLKEDYGVSDNAATRSRKRRACERLKRSPVHRVRDAHLLIKDNTEIAFFYLTELVLGTNKDRLSKNKMCGLLDEYGPHLRINKVTSSGGLFLVEVCRARQVKESILLRCVQELVEQYGALVDVATQESVQTSETALCVASARGLPSVVRYLLQKGASRNITSSGRFRLHSQPKKTLRCTCATALEFATAMRDMEKAAGASDRALADLHQCIRLLTTPKA